MYCKTTAQGVCKGTINRMLGNAKCPRPDLLGFGRTVLKQNTHGRAEEPPVTGVS